MQKHNLNCIVRPKYRKSTGQPFTIVENIISIDFNATRPLVKTNDKYPISSIHKINVLSIKYYGST